MPSFTIAINPKGSDVICGTITTEGGKSPPSVQKVEVHEGLPNTFDISLEDDQKLVIDVAATGDLVFDKDQYHASVVPREKESAGSPPSSGGGAPKATAAKPTAKAA